MKSPRNLHDPREIIEESCRILELSLPINRIEKILHYLSLLAQWNRRINLTSLTDPIDMTIFHIVDSLTVFKVMPQGSGLRILDVGTGAGFPGMVLRIADPSLNLTLLDKDAKKIVFLKYVARELGLTDLRFLHSTLDKLFRHPPSPLFDVVVSRAFSSDPSVLTLFVSLLNPGGSVIRMAGPGDSLHGTPPVGLRENQIWEGILPFSSNFRRVTRYSMMV